MCCVTVPKSPLEIIPLCQHSNTDGSYSGDSGLVQWDSFVHSANIYSAPTVCQALFWILEIGREQNTETPVPTGTYILEGRGDNKINILITYGILERDLHYREK